MSRFYKRSMLLLVLLLPYQARSSPGLDRAGCLACHGSNLQEKTCVRCHTPGLRADRAILYGKAPPLTARFDAAGLLQYLRQPVPRYAGKGSMFALTDGQIRAIQPFIEQNRQKKGETPKPERVAAGQKLFLEKGCENCHNGKGPGPILQVGYPLLNARYFATTIKQGRGLMPALALSDGAIQDLYSYISLTQRPREPSAQNNNVSLASGAKLYQGVLASFAAAGCVHCHGSPTHTQGEVKRIFGGAPQSFFMESKGLVQPSTAIESGKDCQNSPLVDRLELRAAETQGRSGTIRGMPLTGEPLSPAAIHMINRWSKLGCPTGTSLLCRPCNARKNAALGPGPKTANEM